MTTAQLVAALNSFDGQCCWQIENGNDSSELAFEPVPVTTDDIDKERLQAATDRNEVLCVAADAILRAWFRETDTSEIPHSWLDTCTAEETGFEDYLYANEDPL